MTGPLFMDQAFIRKLTDIVLANLRNENFSVEKLAEQAGMSHISVYRRIKSIKNQDVSQFIREVRLNRAMEMLQNNEGTVAEIAFRVGFGSATYFNKCFHEYFGFTPGEVRKKDYVESLKNHAGVQSFTSQVQKEPKPKEVVEPESKNLYPKKNIIIASLGILSGLLILYFLYVLILQDRGIGQRTNNPEKSIVVLPFKNLSNDPGNQYFADGIMEDILNNLFLIKSLNVRSRTTAEHFRDIKMTSPQIAKELSVNYVLEGSVLRDENKVRIFIQLIDARNDRHVLSEKFEGDITNQFVLSDNIAKKVADALETVLSSEEILQIEEISTRSPEAYDYYLKARFLFNKANDEQRIDIDREGLMGSAKFYEKAVSLDSTFADAYAGLADAWFTVSAWGWYQPYYEGIEKAKQFSSRALGLDPDCAEAHLVKGAYLVWPERQWEEGRKEMLRSIQLNPNSGYAHQVYAQLLMITGPIEEARLHMGRVIELEPYFWVMHNLNAWIYYFEGRHREAVEACRTARELKSDWIITNWLFFINYSKLGDGENAVKELLNITHSNPTGIKKDDEIMEAYNRSGISGLYEWITEINTNKPIPVVGLSGDRFFTSWWYAIMGNQEKSLYWLERNMESQYRNYTYFNLICTNPDFDIIRDNPRFLKIIDEIGLTHYNNRKAK
jgi:TolB-like protein/AraC-like DNA-binding protein